MSMNVPTSAPVKGSTGAAVSFDDIDAVGFSGGGFSLDTSWSLRHGKNGPNILLNIRSSPRCRYSRQPKETQATAEVHTFTSVSMSGKCSDYRGLTLSLFEQIRGDDSTCPACVRRVSCFGSSEIGLSAHAYCADPDERTALMQRDQATFPSQPRVNRFAFHRQYGEDALVHSI